MVSRFQIEDLLTQDASGVVFRALDTESDRTVAVRRFFPFGAHGGGLSPEEQADYHIAVGRLSGIAHPALRSIICGGCDPVDGMPFIATEWVEGTPLQSFVERGPLPLEAAVHLLRQALEVCQKISMVLGEEDVWVETDARSIIVGDEASGRGATFWISPLRWLGGADGPRGLEAIANLAEDIMGWTGKIIPDHEGDGLGAWSKRIGNTDTKVTLAEALELLAQVHGATPAAAVKRPVLQAVHGEPLKTPKRTSSLASAVYGVITLAAISSGGWALIHWNNARLHADSGAPVEQETAEKTVLAVPIEPPVVAAAPTVAEPAVVDKPPTVVAPRVETEPKKSSVATSKAAQTVSATAAPKPAPPNKPENRPPDAVKPIPPAKEPPPKEMASAAAPKPAPPKQLFKLENSAELLKMEGKEVTFEGVLTDVENCARGKHLYLFFSDKQGSGQALGSVEKRSASTDLSKGKLSSLKGKTIQVSGKIRIDDVNRNSTPAISIEKRASIQVIK